MQKALLTLLTLVLVAPAFAIGGSQVVYTGGTVSQLKDGATGTLDLTSANELRFVYPDGNLEIPYDSIESFEHSKEVSVHLGVAPAVAVALVAHRKKNHFVRISFTDADHLQQVAVFEVPKKMPIFLMPALEARSPQANCRPYVECTLPSSAINRRPKSAGNARGGQMMK